MRAASRPAAQRGVSLIEMMVAISIFVILSLMAFPTWSTWLAGQQVRSVAETVLDGVRVAQGEAIKRNQSVRFVLDTSTGWEAQLASDDSVLRKGLFKEGGGKVDFNVSPGGGNVLIFDGLGRVLKDDGVTPLDERVTYEVQSSTISAARKIRVVVDTAAATGVGIRSCDPALSSGDPRSCPT